MTSGGICAGRAVVWAVLLAVFSPLSCAQSGGQSSAEAAGDAKQTARAVFASEMKKQDHDCAGVEQQQAMNACMAGAAVATEASLNRFYSALRGTLDSRAVNRLRDAQRTWLTYRQQTCDAAADRFRGGTIAPFIHSSCQVRVTRERLKVLYELYGVGYDQ